MVEPVSMAALTTINGAIAAYSILKGGYGFAITAHIEFGTSCSKACRMEDAKCFAISEEGTGYCYIYPFKDLIIAKEVTSKWWCCWVLFDRLGGEHGAGGVGFAQETCRENGLLWLKDYT